GGGGFGGGGSRGWNQHTEGLHQNKKKREAARQKMEGLGGAPPRPPHPPRTDGRFDPANAGRSFDQQNRLDRQRRIVDADVYRGGGLSLQSHGRGRRASERQTGLRSDVAAGRDHWHSRFPRALVYKDRRRHPA